MADNVTITQGTGTTIATEDVGGVQHQKMKIEFGGDGVATLVDASNPLPVTASSLPLPTSAATSTKQSDGSQKTQIVDGSGNVVGTTSNALDVNIKSGAGSGGTAMTDDSAFTVGTTSVTPVAGTYKSVRDSVDDNDGGAFAMTAKRALYTTIETPNGDSAMDETNDAVKVNIVAGSSSGTEYTEDAPAAANPSGGMLIVRRKDTLSVSEVSADGDNIAVNATSKGEVYVKQTDVVPINDNSGSITVDNAGTFAVQATQSGTWNVGTVTTVTNPVAVTDNSGSLTIDAPVGTPAFVRLSDGTSAISTLPVSLASVPSHAVTNAGTFAVQDSQVLIDNDKFIDGVSKVFPVGYTYDEVAGTALTENDVATARVNVNRAVVGAIEDGATRGRYATVTASNALKVDASGVAMPVTDNSGTLTVDAPVGTPVYVRLSDGASAISTLPVSLASVPSHAVTNAGTFAVQATLQAGTALAGQVSASSETSTIYNGATALTPKFVAISASSSGNNTVLAAVTSKKIRVLAYNFIASGTVNVKFQSGAGGTDLTGLKYCVANSGICAPYNPVGWFETASSTLLNLNLSGAVAVGGELVYVEVV